MSLAINLVELERYFAKSWREYSKHDPLGQLSFNEYDYLRVVQSHSDGIRITDLANEMRVTKPSASNMVAKLVSKGLVKTQSSTTDARAKVVLLTEKAQQDMDQEMEVYQNIAQGISVKLTSEEVMQLTALLNKVTA